MDAADWHGMGIPFVDGAKADVEALYNRESNVFVQSVPMEQNDDTKGTLPEA